MWQIKSLRKRLLIMKLNKSLTNQCYVKRDI